ncbi:hypothetical protein [Nonomuraea lactucae]|uniref:hypothetical protein n=1 Tax=Nonomuraea lactucae TaxID=2249762 RepID=UPI000DE528F9|nr:hypothetical protein [Nonomuraea lactucae]
MSDLDKLAADLAAEGDAAIKLTYDAVRDQAQQLQRTWRANARRTARRHGKHYPSSITNEQIPSTSAAIWEVGPEIGKKQGSMGVGFEYGSSNQPPHWDGTNAAVQQEPKLHQALKDILKDLL